MVGGGLGWGRRGPALLPNGTVVMLFKLCRYPPQLPARQRHLRGAELPG
eukprot:COSAG01_NODE_17286_length_1162_cov_2.127820_2_plen_48_part_01